jgi:hypothetical protein
MLLRILVTGRIIDSISGLDIILSIKILILYFLIIVKDIYITLNGSHIIPYLLIV